MPPVVPATPAKPKNLRFSPTAWAKLLYIRDFGETEVGGFGISMADDPLLVEDFRLVKQRCSWAHVEFDDESVADLFDEQVDNGRRPEQFGRIWIHTHPGQCSQPSSVDEQTFARVFGRADWAVMFILAREGATYCRLRFNVGPTSDVSLQTEVDFSYIFNACDPEGWAREYAANVYAEPFLKHSPPQAHNLRSNAESGPPKEWYEPWFEYLDDDLAMENRDDYRL